MYKSSRFIMAMSGSREMTEGQEPHLENYKWQIGFLRNTGTDPPREVYGTSGPIAFRGRPVRPYV